MFKILNIDEFYHNIKGLDKIDTNFKGNNFHISEKGDLRDLVRYLGQHPEIEEDGE